MVKLVVLYTEPADVQAFEQHFKNIHTPLAQNMPGARKLQLSRFTGGPFGPARFYLMAEVYFETRDDMMAALSSPEGQAAGRDVLSFAGDNAHMMFADVEEP